MAENRFKKYYPWIVVGILWIVSLLNYLDRLMLASMRDPITASIPMNYKQFGMLTTVFLLVYGFLSPFGGYFADRYSRKKVIVLSLLVWSSVTLWTGFVNSFGEMLVARAIMGVSEACYMPAAVALITDYHRGRTRSIASGLLMTGLYAGMALGGAGGYIADIWGWRYGFQFFGIIGIVYSFFLYFILRDAPDNQQETNVSTIEDPENNDAGKISIRELAKNLFGSRAYCTVLIYSILGGMAFWLIYAWLPTYFKERFNLTLGGAGISATAFLQVASLIGVIAGGIIADRWSKINVKGRVYALAIAFIIGGPFLFAMASTGVFLIAIAGITVFGIAKGFNDANLMPIICQIVDKRYRATAYGTMSFFSVNAGGIMIIIGGALKDANISLSVVYQISAVGILLSGLLLLTLRPKKE